jgi:SlyX protein
VSGQDDIRDRLAELESQLAFQDALYQQLNEVVARQDRDLGRLQQQVQELSRRLKEVGDAMAGAAAGTGEETPPHY